MATTHKASIAFIALACISHGVTFSNDLGQTSPQFATPDHTILTSGTVSVLIRDTGLDTDSLSFSNIGSYVTSNFTELTTSGISTNNVTFPVSFSYERWSADFATSISSPENGELPYIYINNGSGAFLYRFNNGINTTIGNEDYTIGDSQDPGTLLFGRIDEDVTTIGGVNADLLILVIPEPSSIALVGLGSLALLARRKR